LLFDDGATSGTQVVTLTCFIHAFVLAGVVTMLDGAGWFAGWADDPAPYDPD
jgi:hypothetical protein